ncbi:kelch-like protein 12 [Haliotis cracherodii]|uniref:kelch-like protein 12 n=1 Tax=Haliotis cracherodii TaxID=6455 RepID=UPI0039E7B954
MAYKQAFTEMVYDKLREQLWKALRQNKDCDVTIKVDADVFHCHKVILAMTSPYFDAKFASGFKGTDEKVIDVQGMSPDTFRNVLEHIYRSNAALKASNVLDVLHASSMFQIESLTKRCERFLIDMYRMSQSWVKQWRAARKYNLEILLEMTNSFMFTNFKTISETALFTSLTAVELCEIVASDELRVTHEADVLKAVLLWTKSQESFSDTDLTQLLSHVSINQISDATFKSTIFPLLQTLGEKARDIVEDVKKEQHMLKKLVVRHNDKPRNTLFGYLEIHGKKALKMYSLEDHKTYDVPALPGIHNVAGIPRGFAFKGDLMFTSLSSVYRLNEQTWSWDNMSLPPIHVIQILSVQHKLYVFGVSDDGVQLLRYKGDEEVAWELVDAIEGEMANCSAAAVGDTIYLVGEDLTAHSPSQIMEKVFILNAFGADAVSCLGRFQPPLSQGKFSVSIASKDDKMYYLTTESEFGVINDANSPQGITRFHQLDGASGCSLSGKGNELMILKTVESKTHIYTVDLEEMTLHLLEDVPALNDCRLGVIKTSIIDKCSEGTKVQRSKETSRHPYSDLELDKRSHSDLTLIVGDASFPCHKIIVKFMSPYMEKHLSAGDGEMTLDDIDDNAFRDILNFMYTGVLPPLCEDNIAAALQAATVLQMDDLQTDIEKKIKVISKDKSPNIQTFKDYL